MNLIMSHRTLKDAYCIDRPFWINLLIKCGEASEGRRANFDSVNRAPPSLLTYHGARLIEFAKMSDAINHQRI
jgi:hypothetical protein